MQYHPENNPKEDLDATIPAVYARRSVQSLRSRPGAGVGESDHRRVRGFRVPLVRPGLSRREDAAQALRGPGAFRVPAFPARGSASSRRARGRGRRGGGRAAQVLADARPALRAPAASEGHQPEAVRLAGGAGPGPVRLRDERARLPAAGARAHRRRREERRAVHARVFRQRRRAGRVLRIRTPVRGGRSRARGVNISGNAEVLDLVIDKRQRDLGGFEVGRVLPFAKRRMVGPFVFFDHMGPIDFAPGIPRSVDVRPHPHIGLSTVTYLFDGEVMHRDSLGSEQAIRPGEVNWMTAGRGITHSERFERARREGGRLHGIQAWVGLPREYEEIEPAFDHYSSRDLPVYESGGLWARLVAGEAFGAKAAVRTHSPLFYVHWRLAAGTRAQLDAQYPERAAYIAAGSVEVEGRTFEAGRLLV